MILLQALPPINVTVQIPPGMPEWARILLAAGTGGVFGMLSNVILEVVKPYFARRTLARRIREQICVEIKAVLKTTAAVLTFMYYPEAKALSAESMRGSVAAMVKSVAFTRYERFMVEENVIMDQLDSEKHLSRCYATFAALTRIEYEQDLYTKMLNHAVREGEIFLEKNKSVVRGRAKEAMPQS